MEGDEVGRGGRKEEVVSIRCLGSGRGVDVHGNYLEDSFTYFGGRP